MAIRITSKKNGFRRCGVEHPEHPLTYPDGHWSPEQLKILHDEPMLIVEEIETPRSGDANPVTGMNAKTAIEKIAQLTLDELNLVVTLDERVTVQRAATERIEAIQKAPES